MATPDGSDEGHIADTGMFKRFVEHEQQMDEVDQGGGARGRWIAVGTAVLIVVVAIVVWLVLR